MGLEPTVTKLGGCIDELEIDLLQSSLLGVSEQRLPEGENPLLGTNTAALHHEKALLNLAVVREAAHGVDRLVRQVILCGSVVLDQLKRIKLNKKRVSIDRVF